jgi:hypothetical protein
MSLNKLWALLYIFLGIGIALWGWMFADPLVQSIFGMVAIFLMCGGVLVWVVESE